MKAEELRIGNFFKYESFENGGIYQVEQICKDSEGFKGYYIKFRNESFATSLEEDEEEDGYKMIQPIPLTEEWLLRFGFEKLTEKGSGFKSTSYTYTGKVALIVHFDGVRLSVNFWQGNEKKYVHQLQNLYFALVGSELIINN